MIFKGHEIGLEHEVWKFCLFPKRFQVKGDNFSSITCWLFFKVGVINDLDKKKKPIHKLAYFVIDGEVVEHYMRIPI
jgi:hypothetical protein